jgi:hypothetical protein
MQLKAPLAMIAATALLTGAAAFAHHSFAMFDRNKVVTLTGTVAEFRWVNPHAALFVRVDRSDDGDTFWAIEMTSPSNLKRRGWTRSTLKQGDRISVEINPLRDGRHSGGFRSATMLDTGKVLGGSLFNAGRS